MDRPIMAQTTRHGLRMMSCCALTQVHEQDINKTSGQDTFTHERGLNKTSTRQQDKTTGQQDRQGNPTVAYCLVPCPENTPDADKRPARPPEKGPKMTTKKTTLVIILIIAAMTLIAAAPGPIRMKKGSSLLVSCPTTLTVTWSNTRHTAAKLKCLSTVAKPEVRVPVTISGTYSGNSSPFALKSGTYRVDVTGVATGSEYDNLAIFYLRNPAGSVFERIIWETVTTPYAYKTYLYNVKPGEYYLDAAAPEGTWTVTFTPA